MARTKQTEKLEIMLFNGISIKPLADGRGWKTRSAILDARDKDRGASDTVRWRGLPSAGHTHLKVAFRVPLAYA